MSNPWLVLVIPDLKTSMEKHTNTELIYYICPKKTETYDTATSLFIWAETLQP
ncbi:hypothetical protein HMPREF9303_0060 [Prevotella denticola CRIS 18C-A]|uniref:Uncharacterized protein n=1 Tax=Prevotella denticola CRIS 18C-A TaxID=944557 RepID=F0H7V3_9BACT|nr:hypothetical protein HMPREF9303_0060 [Prevotella denticola CRIS 18C-A]